MIFAQFSTYSKRALPILLSRAETVFAGTGAPQIVGILNRSAASASAPKLPRISVVPGMSFFQNHLIPKSSFPNGSGIDYRILGVVAAVSLLAVSKKADCSQDEKEVNLNQLSSLVFESISAIKSLEGKEPVLFIGATGSGKSTTLNYMMDIAMRVAEVTPFKVTLETDDLKAFKIGNAAAISETTVVKTRQEPGSKLWLTDCPGYSDTRSVTYKFVSDISSYLATQTAEKVKAVVVTISIDELKTKRAEGLRDLALTLHNFIRNGADAKPSIFFLFTKSPMEKGLFGGWYVKPLKKNEIISTMEEIASGINSKPQEDLTNEDLAARSVIQLMLEGDVTGDGSEEKPFQTGPAGPRIYVIDIFNKGERKKILNAIEAAPGIERDQFNPNIKGNIELSLRNSLLKYLQMGFDIHHMFNLKERQSELRQHIRDREQNIQRIENDLKKQSEGGSLDIQPHIDRIRTDIVEMEKRKTGLDQKISTLNVQISAHDTDMLVPYWDDQFLSAGRFFDFYPRDYTFDYKQKPYSQAIVEDQSHKNGIIPILTTIGDTITNLPNPEDPRLMAAKYAVTVVNNVLKVMDNGTEVADYKVIKKNPSGGEYKSKFSVRSWGATGDIKVTIKGPQKKRDDVVLLLSSLRSDLEKTKKDLAEIEADKAQKTENLKELSNVSFQIDALKKQKTQLETEITKATKELQQVCESSKRLEEEISENQKNLNNTLSLIQLDLIRSLLKLDPGLVSIFEENVRKLSHSGLTKQ